jgi:hypothetical protein
MIDSPVTGHRPTFPDPEPIEGGSRNRPYRPWRTTSSIGHSVTHSNTTCRASWNWDGFSHDSQEESEKHIAQSPQCPTVHSCRTASTASGSIPRIQLSALNLQSQPSTFNLNLQPRAGSLAGSYCSHRSSSQPRAVFAASASHVVSIIDRSLDLSISRSFNHSSFRFLDLSISRDRFSDRQRDRLTLVARLRRSRRAHRLAR